MKKLLIFLIFGMIFISLASVSALEFDNVLKYNEESDEITITNAFNLGSDLIKAKLDRNFCEENRFCEADKTVTLYTDSPLVEDFKTIRLDDRSNEEQNIRWHRFEYWGIIEDYETQCSDGETIVSENGTSYTEIICEQVKTGEHEGWIEFKEGDIFQAGTYKVRTTGEIKPSRVYDWQIKIAGKWTTPWAIWGAVIGVGGVEANVTLNSPADGSTAYVLNNQFNATATVTGGATLVNMSLFTNETGTFELKNSTYVGALTESHGISLGTGTTGTNYVGFVVTMNGDYFIRSIYKSSLSNVTKAYLRYNTNSTTISSADFIGDYANFSSPIKLLAGQSYQIVTESSGETYTARISADLTGTFPRNGGIYNITSGYNGGVGGSLWNILSVLYSPDSGTTSTQTWNRTITDDIIWNVQACDSDGDCGFATSNYTLSIDTTKPVISVSYPTATIDYGYQNQNTTLSYQITDTNLNQCWWEYNSTNTSIPCTSGSLNISYFNLQKDVYTGKVWANDSVGNTNYSQVDWEYKVFENSFTYNNETRVGDQEDFSLDLTIGDGYDISSVIFHYNGYTESPSIFSDGNNRVINITDYAIPTFGVDTNVTVYFEIILDDLSTVNSTNQIQLVEAIFLDNCSSYSNTLFNITLLDEVTQQKILGNIEFYYSILNVPAYDTISMTNLSFTNVSNVGVCSDINLTGQNFVQSIEMRYVSDGYAPEFYHIQRSEISPETKSISLYDLNESASTEFKITYQDDTFNFVEGAIIQLQRRYISEDSYKVVEAPLTSNEGTALVHIDLDSVKYKATVVKNGEVLDTFDNIVFKCQSELTGECEQKLLGDINPQNTIDYDTNRDFSYSVTPGENNITVSFSIPSSTPSSINLALVQKDQWGNTTQCNKTITSSGGSIQCTYNNSLEISYLELSINKDGVPIGRNTYVVDDKKGSDFFDNNYIFVVVIILSLVGIALTSPEWIVMNVIVTLLLAGLLWLVNGIDFVLGLGILMWLVIAAGIIIFKLAKQEDK